jgi:NAD(P)-dependent dehydrogenase (short-subunit alcohol dehydrogenase family)
MPFIANYLIIVLTTSRCFLALKYASEAMKVLNPKSGKTESSGSIIMTASVAGIRSGAGPVDCTHVSSHELASAYVSKTAQAKLRTCGAIAQCYHSPFISVNSMVYTGSFQLAGTNIRANSICPGLIEVS